MQRVPATFLCIAMLATASFADTVVATRTIRAQTPLTAADMAVVEGTIPGGFSDPFEAEGMEARVTLYAGRPIRISDLAQAAVIERNQIVTLFYMQNGLRIATEARSLDRASPGDRVRVMNLSSRVTVSGSVDRHGRVVVGPSNELLADLEKN